MFTIDLLNGEGIPAKSRPEKVVVMAITAAAPVLIALVMLGIYLGNRVGISVQKQEVTNYQERIENLSDSLVAQETFAAEKQHIDNCKTEAAQAINRHTQWSGILVALAKNIPDSLVLNDISVEQRNVRVKIPRKDKPGEEVDIFVPARTLNLNIGANMAGDSDKEVRDFRDRLRYSDEFGSKLEDIIVSQEVEMLNDREIISYEMKCVFKPQI